MTARPLPRSRLANLVPPLVHSQAVVALVPATGDLRWAAAAAWDVARAAVPPDRRVALVDLWLDEPRLHEVVGLAPGDGIVDAFEYGVSLNAAAHPVDGVFFIAAGSYTPNTSALLGHSRWQKLHGGFRAEGALLLLFVSAGALGRLGTVPDALMVLSPDGLDPESTVGREIHAAVERGIPLLGVVRERWTPAPHDAPRAPDDARPQPRRRAARPAVVAATLAAGVAGGLGLWARDFPLAHVGRPEPPPAAPAPLASPPPAPAPAPAPARADTLAWAVQLAAYGTIEKALSFADRLNAADNVGAFITPVPLGRRTVWYRVLAGPYPTRDSAVAARAVLWQQKAVPEGQGDLLWAPYTLALGANADVDRLRRDGIPAIPRPGGSTLLVGAFESAEQATLAETRLKRAGVHASLVSRVDTIP
jgi:hypothetical protein